MSERRLYLDRGLGETRGVVLLDGRPERLLIRREEDDLSLALGARLAARVESVESALSIAFLDLGRGLQAILPFKPDTKPMRGALLEVEVRSEARRGKLPTVRALGPADGAPRLLSTPPDMSELLRAFARDVEPIEGKAAREAADEAEAEALEVVHPLPGGGTLAIEPTRALTALDVDVGERKGGDSKRVTRQANLVALREAARLLRLKGLGGLVVIDLAGRGHDSAALIAAARAAFAPDNPGVAIGPVGRFGTMEISLPRRTRPVLEKLLDERGRLTDRALAQRLVRRIQSEAEAQPGARLVAACHPAVATAAQSLARALAERLGARFSLSPDPARAREAIDVRAV